MGKFNISLSDATEDRLKRYVSARYPGKFRMLSATVEEAVKTFLDRPENK